MKYGLTLIVLGTLIVLFVKNVFFPEPRYEYLEYRVVRNYYTVENRYVPYLEGDVRHDYMRYNAWWSVCRRDGVDTIILAKDGDTARVGSIVKLYTRVR